MVILGRVEIGFLLFFGVSDSIVTSSVGSERMCWFLILCCLWMLTCREANGLFERVQPRRFGSHHRRETMAVKEALSWLGLCALTVSWLSLIAFNWFKV
ncbi:hypothetical protein J1N35_014778 [Gossypium stocksii]|uniref:Uncharacterized protein n=1 Tax=Gossypium stocksii TaxID=47602 RepID=A0A9D3VVH1_9ROSI|nr:hypothetical protein J1N35_014778 [Gossypium stocksii]